MTLAEYVCPSASVRRFQIEDGLLLFNADSDSLFVLNSTASYLWDLIGIRQTKENLASELSREWEIPFSRARADVESIVEQWRLRGLLAGSERRATVVAAGAVDWRRAPSPRWTAEWICTIRGVAIAFGCENRPIVPIRQLLEHLETPTARPEMRVEFRKTPDGHTALVCDGVERVRSSDSALLMGGLWQTILEIINPDCVWLALIHGAVIARGGNGIALCAPSGSGKTTLTAALINGGFDYFADDLVALTAPEGTVLPWPLPLGVKSGSETLLAPYCPGLAQARRYRTKGIDARLLIPAKSTWYADPVPLRTLVFPRFSEGAAASLERISCVGAVERLLTDRIWIGNPITADRVEVFLNWLRQTPAYTCVYGKLDDGIRLMKDLVR